MKKIRTTALLGAAIAGLAFAAPTPAAAADNSSKACKAIGNNPSPFPQPGETFTHGACVSVFSSGRLRGAAYSSQCRNLERELGGYPIAFVGDEGIITPPGVTPVARNHGQCVVILRKLHQATGA